MKKSLLIFLLFISLCGCRLEDKSVKDVVQRLDDSRKEITGKMDKMQGDLVTSNNNTQNALNGMINASVSKLGEKVTGIESRIEKIVGFETKIDKLTGLEAEVTGLKTTIGQMNTQLSSVAEANVDLKAKLDAVINVNTKLQADLKASLEIGTKIDTKIEKINATAGHDVNMLPQSAVDVILGSARNNYLIICALCGLASTTIAVFARNSRKRAELRYKEEREERKELLGLITKGGGNA